jgi:hypothetical protein
MQANDLLFCANSALNRGGRVGSAPKDPAPHFVKNAMPSYRNGSQFANFVIGDVWRGIEDIELARTAASRRVSFAGIGNDNAAHLFWLPWGLVAATDPTLNDRDDLVFAR